MSERAAPRQIGEEAIVELLKATQLFSALDPGALLTLARAGGMRTYGKGQYLWYQGDDADRMVIVRDGRAKVVLTSHDGDDVVLATIGPGESIGELAVVDGSPRSASVVTAEPTSVFSLSRAAALEVMANEPVVLRSVLAYLGSLVRRLTEQTGDLVFLDLGGRLSKLLLRLAEVEGQGHPKAAITIRLSQSELAAMVGASRPSVNRALQLLAGRGLLSVHGREIVLLDPAALRRRAGI